MKFFTTSDRYQIYQRIYPLYKIKDLESNLVEY